MSVSKLQVLFLFLAEGFVSGHSGHEVSQEPVVISNCYMLMLFMIFESRSSRIESSSELSITC